MQFHSPLFTLHLWNILVQFSNSSSISIHQFNLIINFQYTLLNVIAIITIDIIIFHNYYKVLLQKLLLQNSKRNSRYKLIKACRGIPV